jgi:hypothetical protein
MVYRPYEVGRDSGAMVIYRDGGLEDDGDEVMYGAKSRLVGDTQVGWVYCMGCKVREYCATQIIDPRETGCRDREKLLVVSGLEKRHFKEAKRSGRSRELQVWRDKRRGELEEKGGVQADGGGA